MLSMTSLSVEEIFKAQQDEQREAGNHYTQRERGEEAVRRRRACEGLRQSGLGLWRKVHQLLRGGRTVGLYWSKAVWKKMAFEVIDSTW